MVSAAFQFFGDNQKGIPVGFLQIIGKEGLFQSDRGVAEQACSGIVGLEDFSGFVENEHGCRYFLEHATVVRPVVF